MRIRVGVVAIAAGRVRDHAREGIAHVRVVRLVPERQDPAGDEHAAGDERDRSADALSSSMHPRCSCHELSNWHARGAAVNNRASPRSAALATEMHLSRTISARGSSGKRSRFCSAEGGYTLVVRTLLFLLAACSASDDVPAPVVSGVQPNHGPPGSSVIVTGDYFCGQPMNGSDEVDPVDCAFMGYVEFGTVHATSTQYADTSITTDVPEEAAGPVRVVVEVTGRISNDVTFVIE